MSSEVDTRRFTIVGTGAIGGVTGGYLARAGHTVQFVDVVEEHVRAINERGLRVSGRADFTVRTTATTPDELRPPLGTVVIAVKSHHTLEALAGILPHLGPTDMVVSMQNGLVSRELAGVVGREAAVAACLSFGGYYAGPGHVVHGTAGSLGIGRLDGKVTAELVALAEALSAVEHAHATGDIFACIWGKMALGSLYFATAIVDADVREILDRTEYREVLMDVCAETVAVAEAQGIHLAAFAGFDPNAMRFGDRDPAAVEAAVDGVRGFFDNPHQARTGIWLDLAVRKRRTEADAHLGALLAEAGRVGVRVPGNAALYVMVKQLEAGHRRFAWSNLDELRDRMAAARV